MECQQTVETSKLNYLKNLGNKVNDPSTSQKSCWKIINRVMNKCRAPTVPSLLVNNMFIFNRSEQAKLFNDFFSKQCRPITTSSLLPTLNLLTDIKIDHIHPVWWNNLLNSEFIPKQGIRFWWNIWSNDTSVWQLSRFTSQNNLSKYSGSFYLPRYMETC